ncbi:MAG: class I SAM-dependent methyltransferase [Planctomycetota bacterium]|jgi:ubiquinone/menaquinone biosynthesis C-methylase UbiE
MDGNEKHPVNDEIVSFYTKSYDESKRLTDGFGQLEQTRTEELIVRFLPKPPAVILDVGGATGIYSFFVAGLGHEVHLVDIVPNHIEQAKALSGKGDKPALASARIGDARSLDFADASIDVVMMHGPLYHLPKKDDRKQALTEAWRVLRPGGALLAVAINRYAGAIYGITKGLIYDAEYMRMIRTEVETGRRTNPPDGVSTFPNAIFLLPEEVKHEIEAVRFTCEKVLGIVGPAWLVPEIDSAWNDPIKRNTMLDIARMLENEPILGPRILAIGRKPLR